MPRVPKKAEESAKCLSGDGDTAGESNHGLDRGGPDPAGPPTNPSGQPSVSEPKAVADPTKDGPHSHRTDGVPRPGQESDSHKNNTVSGRKKKKRRKSLAEQADHGLEPAVDVPSRDSGLGKASFQHGGASSAQGTPHEAGQAAAKKIKLSGSPSGDGRSSGKAERAGGAGNGGQARAPKAGQPEATGHLRSGDAPRTAKQGGAKRRADANGGSESGEKPQQAVQGPSAELGRGSGPGVLLSGAGNPVGRGTDSLRKAKKKRKHAAQADGGGVAWWEAGGRGLFGLSPGRQRDPLSTPTGGACVVLGLLPGSPTMLRMRKHVPKVF
jgi:hypothetical protein